MTESIAEIEEEDERSRSRRIAYSWSDFYQTQCNPIGDDVIFRKDLSAGEIDLLERTASCAREALLQTDLSPTPLRKSISKNTPAGSNAVASVAKSAAIAASPKIRSLFDLSSSMGKNPNKTHSSPEDLDAFRVRMQDFLQHLDSETVQTIKEIFTQVQDPSSAIDPLSANRPRLSPPRRDDKHAQNYMLLVLDLNQSMEEIISDYTDHLNTQTQRDVKEMERLREEKIKALEEHIRAMDNQESWSTLANMARYVTFASTAAFGYAIGGPAGAFLMASGGLGIANAAATDLGVWKSIVSYFNKSTEVQSRIAQEIDLLFTFLSIGLGLVGGVFAYQTNALELARQANPGTMFTKTLPTLKWFTALFAATTFTGKAFADRRDSLTRGKIEAIEAKLFLIREQLKSTDNQMHQAIKMAEIITQETARILASAELSLAN